MFYEAPGEVLSQVSNLIEIDLRPREAFVALCLRVPIIGIGLYPKLATPTFDAKTVSVSAQGQEIRLGTERSTGI